MAKQAINPFLIPEEPKTRPKRSPLTPVCGFRPMNEEMLLPENKPTFIECDDKGHLTRIKYENGVKVILEHMGNVKTFGNNKIYKTMLMTLEELEKDPEPTTTAIELAARALALNAAKGDKHSITEIFDRTLGKPKQVTENYSVVKTIDDVLNEVFDENDEPRSDAKPIDPIDITPKQSQPETVDE